MTYRSALVVAMTLMIIISMSSVANCYGSGTPVASVHVFGDLSSCSRTYKWSPRNQPLVAHVSVALWCGTERIPVGETLLNPSGAVDFTFDVADGLFYDQSHEFSKCLVALGFFNTACAAQLHPVNGLDVGSTVQQLLGGGDHQDSVAKYEAKDFIPFSYHA